MIPDIDFVKTKFNKFNGEIFSNDLPLPVFKLTRAHTFRGKLIYKIKRSAGSAKACDFEMRISTLFDLNPDEWEDVIIHEMIHLKIAALGIKDSSSHGPAFRRAMHEINRRHNRNICVSARSTATEASRQNADRRVKAHYVCLTRLADGRLCIAPAAKTRIFKLWDMKRYFPDIVSMRWVGTIDSWFNAFPHVQKPKLYIVKEEELKPRLKGAQLLEKYDNVIKVVNRRCSPDELLP